MLALLGRGVALYFGLMKTDYYFIPDMNLVLWACRLRDQYLKDLESIFGRRSSSHELGGIVQSSKNNPSIYELPGKQEIVIRLSPNAINDLKNKKQERAKFQIAHECVHLLDPIVGDELPVSVLEEGIAGWFEKEKSTMSPGSGPAGQQYIKAYNLVLPWMEDLKRIIKPLRDKGLRIHDITDHHLITLIPGIGHETAKALTEGFYRGD